MNVLVFVTQEPKVAKYNWLEIACNLGLLRVHKGAPKPTYKQTNIKQTI